MKRRQPPARERVTPTRRERNRKKPDVLGTLRLVLAGVLVLETMHVLFFSPRLRLQEVRVGGSKRYAAADIIGMAHIPMGQNIFRVNLVRAEERLEALPVVKDATVTREFPSTLGVELKERTPAFQLACAGETLLADEEGVVFEPAATPDPKLLTLEVTPKEQPQLGGKVRKDLVNAVWETRNLAKKEGLNVAKMRVDEGGQLWLNIATQPTIVPAAASIDETDGAKNGGRGTDNTESAEIQKAPGELAIRIGRATELAEKFRDIRLALQGWPDLPTSAAYLDVVCAGHPAKRLADAKQ